MKQALTAHVLLVCSLATAAHAQCDGAFLPGPDQQYPGIKGTVLASTSWDPDGAGPQPSLLIVGGSFTIAGESLTSNIAAWDGAHWIPLGAGVSGPVHALATFQGELIAAGHFSTAGDITANHIASWNGSQWRALGSGVDSSAPNQFQRRIGAVTALAVFNGELVVGGSFSAAGATPAANVAKWDGNAWHALGAGVSNPNFQPVNAMCVHQGDLYVGGYLTTAGGAPANKLARWDGAQWHSLDASGPHQRVLTLASYQGNLIIGGAFEAIGETWCSSIARWDGAAFHPMGDNELYSQNNSPTPVYSLAIHDDELYAAGDFFVWSSASEIAYNVASWDGAAWRRVATEQTFPATTLANHNGRLVAGTTNPDRTVLELAGDTWHPLSRGLGPVAALAVFQGELIAGGTLEQAGGAPASGVARWDGQTWDAMGLTQYSGVRSLAVFNDHLVVGGTGPLVGTALGAGIIQWDGNGWSTLGPAPSGRGDDIDVRALVVNGGSLVAAGSFSHIGDVQTSNIARWDGASWHAMGAGLPSPVATIASFDGEWLAVNPSTTVKRFDGVAWQPLGPSMSGPVMALLPYQGQLIAAGTFQSAGGNPVSNIARWDAGSWSPVGAGLTHPVNVLTTFAGTLVALGATSSNGQWTAHLSRWDGAAWNTQPIAVDGLILGAIEYNNQLIIAGEFTTIDGRVSAYWTRWSPPTADFNHDGDVGTDLDIEAFFACLAGQCCPACSTADFNADGDSGTDADIESFFRVLAGGPC